MNSLLHYLPILSSDIDTYKKKRWIKKYFKKGSKKKEDLNFIYYTDIYRNEIEKKHRENNKYPRFRVIGNISLRDLKKIQKKDREDNKNIYYLELLEDGEKYPITKKIEQGITVGYIRVSEENYIRISKPNYSILVLLFIMFFIFLLFIFKSGVTDDSDLEIGGNDSNGIITNNMSSQASTGQIEIAGYSYLYVTKNEPTIQLINPKSNDVYFKYIIKISGSDDVLYETTKLISPGKAINWNAFETLNSKKGVYSLDFYIQTFDMNTLNNCQGSYMPNIQIEIR